MGKSLSDLGMGSVTLELGWLGYFVAHGVEISEDGGSDLKGDVVAGPSLGWEDNGNVSTVGGSLGSVLSSLVLGILSFESVCTLHGWNIAKLLLN